MTSNHPQSIRCKELSFNIFCYICSVKQSSTEQRVYNPQIHKPKQINQINEMLHERKFLNIRFTVLSTLKVSNLKQ